MDQIIFGLVTAIVAALVGYLLYSVRPKSKEIEEVSTNDGGSTSSKRKKPQPTVSKKVAKSKEKDDKKQEPKAHPWLAGNLKGHMGGVLSLDFSLNEKFLASCADDRTAMIWTTKDFLDTNHKQIRVNLGFDIANQIFWSPDSKAFVVSTKDDSSIQVYKLGKKPDGSVGNVTQGLSIEKAHSGNTIVGLAIACNGKFMISASADGRIKLWDLKGALLKETRSELKALNALKLSACGRYIGLCGTSSKLLVWSISYDKNGAFDDIKPAYHLDGHASEIHSIDFNLDATIIVSADAAGVWRLFDTTGTKATLRFSNTVSTKPDSGNFLTAISNDSCVSAVASGTEVVIFAAKSGTKLATLESHYESSISALQFSPDGKYLVTSTGGDRSIKIFHNVCGYTEKVKDLKDQAKSPDISSHLKERLLQESDAVKNSLKQLNLKSLT